MRRYLAALLFALSFAPAFAQAPPPVAALPDTERRTSYSISTSTCACSVGFQLYNDSTDVDAQVEVWISGVRYLSTDPSHGWGLTSVTGPLATIPRPITNAVLTFVAPQTGTIQIVGAERPRRLSQFSENRGVAARDLNQALTAIIAGQREIWDKTNDVTGRSMIGPPGDSMTQLPPAASRAGSLLAFDGSGNPIMTSPNPGLGTVVGPSSSVNNDVACWNGTTGALLRDCGAIGATTLTGDVTGGPSVGTVATTFATVNSNVGSFGSATQVPQITVNGKGLTTAAANVTITPPFSALTGQATLAQLPTIANSTILGNVSGGSTTPSALSPSAVFDVFSTTQGSILYRDSGAWVPLGPGTSGQLLTTNGAGADPSWTTASGTGTVTSLVCGSGLSGGTITATGTCALLFDPGSITNCTLVGTVSGNALTVALKTQAGADPTSTTACIVSFRSATAATGTYTAVLVTAATSFVTGATGSTFGTTNSQAFKLWITAWNNAGTVVLGASTQSNSTNVFPLNEGAVQSSTACNACTSASSAGVFYTTATQTSKAIRILGYMEWASGLGTAGVWASGPTSIQMFGPGVKKPGDVVQYIYATSTTTATTTGGSYAALTSGLSQSITPTSASNPIRVVMSGDGQHSVSNTDGFLQLTRGASTQIGSPIRLNETAGGFPIGRSLSAFDFPNTTSSTAYAAFGKTSGGTISFPPSGSSVTLELFEIMGALDEPANDNINPAIYSRIG